MTRRSLFKSRTLFVAALAIGLLCVPTSYLVAQKTVPSAPRSDDVADMAYCPQYIAATFYGDSGGTYNGFLGRGADGIGKVYYRINGITNVGNNWAAFGTLYVYGWVCVLMGNSLHFLDIPNSNVSITERRITPIDLACGGTGGGGGGEHPPTGGDANRVVPVRFDCQGGGSGTTTVTIVTVTTCYGWAYYDVNGNFLFAELRYCTQFQYMM